MFIAHILLEIHTIHIKSSITPFISHEAVFAYAFLKKIGFAFSQQLVDDVPTEDHDVNVDMVVSDEGIRNCN